jgi:hypothetical protein
MAPFFQRDHVACVNTFAHPALIYGKGLKLISDRVNAKSP